MGTFDSLDKLLLMDIAAAARPHTYLMISHQMSSNLTTS